MDIPPEIPDPSCYGCLGTGKIQGFGQQGKTCPCTTCHGCGEPADHVEEGRAYCSECDEPFIGDNQMDFPHVYKVSASVRGFAASYVLVARDHEEAWRLVRERDPEVEDVHVTEDLGSVETVGILDAQYLV